MAPQPAQLSDDELSSARLEIDDPLSLPNLSLERPPADNPPEIVGEYHLPQGHDLVWCCHCQSHSHRNGFAVTNSTGQQYLLGSECGPKHYGFAFEFAARDHKAKVKRKGILDRLKAIVATAPAVKASIQEILTSEGLQLLDAKRHELWRASSNAFSALATSVKTEMPLYEMVRVRDLAAEQRRDDQLPDDEIGAPIYRHERMSLGNVAGAGLVRHSYYCRDRLLGLSGAIDRVIAIHDEITDRFSIKELTKAVREAEDAWQTAKAAIEEAELADAFFTGGNLNRLERWSRGNRYFTLIAEDPNLVAMDSTGKRVTITPLSRTALPRLPTMKVD
jgi:hypothetical protein